ncbi:MAG: ABC transporter substrate-binding protein [Anaerolineales bacterium]|nr:ABC transporter substrate-binding protein [Anaerolineales bacterium]
MNKIHIRFFSTLAVMAFFINACAGGNPFRANDKVNVQLSWFPSVEYAGFYAAIDQGYYADENIDVTLTSGDPTIDVLNEVDSGNAQFGISTGDSLIIARAKQQNFLAVATIFRKSPLVVFSLQEEGIEKPSDLNGKKVGVISPDLSTTWDVQFLALLQSMGIDRNNLNFSTIEDYHGANELTSGNLDAMSGMFATNEPVMANMEGNELNLIYYQDYGVNVYANTLFVSEELAQSNPDLISRFVKATLRGYQFAIENPEAIAVLALNYDETLDLTFQQEVMKAQIPFIDTGDAPIGSMDESVWNSTQKILLDFGLISAPIDLNLVFTNKFIP